MTAHDPAAEAGETLLIATGYEHRDGRNISTCREHVRIVIDPDLPRRGECRPAAYGYTIALREMNAAVLLHEMLHILIDRHVPHDGPGGLNHRIINTIEVGLLPHLPALVAIAQQESER